VPIPDDTTEPDPAACIPVDVPTWPMAPPAEIQDVQVAAGVNSPWIGDLTLTLASPIGTVVTLMARPGVPELGALGSPANLNGDYPISFGDGLATDAESMGATLIDSQTVCLADAVCDFFPNPGPMAAFDGQTPGGTWLLCGMDSAATHTAYLDAATLTLWFDESDLCSPDECGGGSVGGTCYCDDVCFETAFDCCLNFCEVCDLGC
jgi:subtilisin-like proprotein convertase family protein